MSTYGQTNVGEMGLQHPQIVFGVGPAYQECLVPKSLALKYSKYFRNHSDSLHILLPRVSLADFEAFRYWLYVQTLPPESDVRDTTMMMRLYVFAEKFWIPKLKNKVIDEYVHIVNKSFPRYQPGTLDYLLTELPHHSPFFRLLKDSFSPMIFEGRPIIDNIWVDQ